MFEKLLQYKSESRVKIMTTYSGIICALLFLTGKSHALHKRVEQLCTRAIRWAELKRKTKVIIQIYKFFQFIIYFLGDTFMGSELCGCP